jgi:uncharacterized membrane protein YkoI
MRLKQFVFVSIVCVLPGSVFADDNSKAVAFSETPPAVQKTIQAQAGNGTLGEVDQDLDDGETVYNVELTAKDGTERDFTVDEDGTLLSVEVPLAETPAAVQKSVQTLKKQGDLEEIDKDLDDSEITYDIELTAKDGGERDFTLADDGTLLSAGVTLSETPAAVQKTIHARLGEGKLESIEKNFDDDGISYDVEMTTKEGREKDFTVAANGSLSSVQVELREAPRGVQRTIKNRIGDGRILEIDKSFEKERGVFPYEVQGQKDGKPFDFSVGPRGRFLGMDD